MLKWAKITKLNPVFFDTIINSIWHIIGKGIGFFIPIFIASIFGINNATDAFFFSYSIVWFITVVISNTSQTAIVPLIAEKQGNSGAINEYINDLIIKLIAILLILCIIVLIIIKPLILIITNFSEDVVNKIFLIILFLFPTILFLASSGFIEGLLNFHKKYWASPLATSLRSTVILIIIFLFSRSLNILSIVLGYLTGELVYLLILLYLAGKYYNFKLNFKKGKTKSFRTFFQGSLGIFMFCFFNEINFIVDNSMSSYLGVGSVSLIVYSEKIFLILYNILPLMLSKVLLSDWSIYWHIEKKERLLDIAFSLIKKFALFFVPIFLILFLLRQEITTLVYLRGNFPADKIHQVSELVGFQILIIIPTLLIMIISRYLVVIKQTNVLILISVLRTVINVVGNLICMKIFGLVGILISTLLHTSLFAIYLFTHVFISNKKQISSL